MKWICGNLSEFGSDKAEKVYRELSLSRKERIDRYKIADDRRRSLLGEYLVKELLKTEYSLYNATVESSENGRPFLKESKLFISISHSGEKVVCAVGKQPIGIDIEKPKPIKYGLINRVCTDSEKLYVLDGCDQVADEVSDKGIISRFFEIWTGKEAYFKAQGTGITDFKSVEILSLKREVITIGDYIVHIVENHT